MLYSRRSSDRTLNSLWSWKMYKPQKRTKLQSKSVPSEAQTLVLLSELSLQEAAIFSHKKLHNRFWASLSEKWARNWVHPAHASGLSLDQRALSQGCSVQKSAAWWEDARVRDIYIFVYTGT